MENIFDDEEGKELRNSTFRVNLGVNSGLAGIIIDIREAIASSKVDTPDEESAPYKLYTALTNKNILREQDDTYDIEISKPDLKELIETGLFTYEKES